MRSQEVVKIIDISSEPGEDYFGPCAEDGRVDFLVMLNPKDFPQEKLSGKVVSPTSSSKWCAIAKAYGNQSRLHAPN